MTLAKTCWTGTLARTVTLSLHPLCPDSLSTHAALLTVPPALPQLHRGTSDKCAILVSCPKALALKKKTEGLEASTSLLLHSEGGKHPNTLQTLAVLRDAG